jgi:transcriptional regulator with XRE-family HTH domain
MNTVNERIVYLIDTLCSGNKSAFARKINITPAYAAQLYKMERIPSDRTISDICRIFNVNPEWLRNGAEPMFMPEPDDDTAYINELLTAVDDPVVDIIKAFMGVYMTLNDEDKKKARAFAANLKSKIKENRD